MRSRLNGGVIGVPTGSTISGTSGSWSFNEINKLETNPVKPAMATVRYTTPEAWPTTGNVSGNVDPFAAQKVFHVPDLDFDDWVQKDQSANAWHEYVVHDQTYRGTYATAFGPAYRDWSIHFYEDGYYRIQGAIPRYIGTNNFTIEFWVKLQRQDATTYWVMGNNNTAGNIAGTGWGIFVSPTYQIGWHDAIANIQTISSTTLTRDTWYHVAFTRANLTANGFSVHVNGNLEVNSNLASNYSLLSNLYIGRDGVGTAASYFGGKLCDLRMSTQQARYSTTSNITVPTSNLALPVAGAGFSMSSTAAGHETMGNIHPQGIRVTFEGSVVKVVDSPYMDQSTMPTGPGYNSMYGYGTEGGFKIYDTNPTNTSLRLGTAFTVEAWIYLANTGSTGTASGLIGKGTLNVNTAGGTGWNFYTNGSFLIWNDGATTLLTSGTYLNNTIAKCGWHHIAAVREGTGANQFKMYIDGVTVFIGTLASDYSAITDPMRIMNTRNADYYFRGYVSGLRISNVAVYTSNFDASPQVLIPKSIKAFSANTVLLMGAQTNSDIARAGRNGWMDRGKARLPVHYRNTEARQGQHHPAPIGVTGKDRFSMYFSGTGNDSCAMITTTNDWDFGTGDFSIELWVHANFQSVVGSYYFIFDSRRYFADNGIAMRFGTANNGIEVYTGNQVVLSNNKIALDVKNWVHLVIQRVSGAMALYANGYKVCETIYTGSIVSTDSRMIFGNSVYPNLQYTSMFRGFMSDVRITKGSPSPYAVNGANPDYIQVPTDPVPVTASTVLSTFNSPIFRDLSSKNNFVYWNTSQYVSGSWDFYITNQSPYASTPANRDTAIIGDTHDNNSGWYQADGPFTGDSTRPEYSFITRFSIPWTIEAWLYWHNTSTTAPATVVDYIRTANAVGHEGFNLRLGYGNAANSYNNISFAVYLATSNLRAAAQVQFLYTTFTANNTIVKAHSWNHVAVQYNPTKTNKMAIFVNGFRANTAGNLNVTSAANIGSKVWHTYQVSVTNAGTAGFRISDTARYDNDAATYTVPTQNFAYDRYTYSHYDTGRTCVWTDYGRKASYYSYGTPYPSTAFKKFGKGSLRFSNRDTATFVDRVVWGASYWNARPFDTEKQDWTFECWASWWDAASGGVAIGASGNSVFNFSNYLMLKVSSTGFWQLIRGTTTTVYQTITTTVQVATRSAGTWDHVCIVRRNGSYIFYVNGIERGNIFGNGTGTYANLTVGPTTEINDNFAAAALDARLGSDNQATVNAWNGYVQDARFTYLARYTTKVINGVATMVHVNTLLPALPTAIHPR